MRKITAYFNDHNRALDALRAAGITTYQGGGVVFDNVQHTGDNRLTQLTLRGRQLVVPTSNLLMVVIDEVTE